MFRVVILDPLKASGLMVLIELGNVIWVIPFPHEPVPLSFPDIPTTSNVMSVPSKTVDGITTEPVRPDVP